MKHFMRSVKGIVLRNTLLLMLAACAVWFYGPALNIGFYAPLAATTPRLIVLFLLVFAWGAAHMQLAFRLKANASQTPGQRPSVKAIKRHYRALFKKNKLTSHHHKLWIWFLSLPETGVSTLLTNSGFKLISDDYEPVIIWHSDTQLAFECRLKDQQQARLHLKGLKQLRGANPIDRLYYVTKPEFLNQQRPLTVSLKHVIQAFAPFNHAIQLVVTQCDLIPGFVTCFEKWPKEYAKQLAGFSLDGHDKTCWSEDFKAAFDAFMRRLNHFIFENAHYPFALHKRQAMIELPQQMAHYQPSLERFGHHLQQQSDLIVQAVYWVSASQSYDKIDPIESKINDRIPLKSHESTSWEPLAKPLQSPILFEETPVPNTQRGLSRNQTLALCAGCVLLTTLGFGIPQWSVPFMPTISLTQARPMSTSSLKKGLRQSLKNDKGVALFNDLMAVRMLNHPNERHLSFLISQMKRYDKQATPDRAIAAWLDKNQHLQLNNTLLEMARARLKPSISNVVMDKLRQAYRGELELMDADESFTGRPVKISNLYTRAHLNDIWSKDLPKLAQKTVLIMDWPKNQVTSLTALLSRTYLNQYIQQWNSALQSMRLTQKPHSQKALKAALTAARQAPLALLTLKSNVNLNDGPEAFMAQSADYFDQVKALKKQDVQDLEGVLQTLIDHLNLWEKSLTASDSIDFVSKRFQVYQKDSEHNDPLSRLKQLASRIPQPLSSSLDKLATGYWHHAINTAAKAIDHRWAQTVSDFNEYIQTCYPFNADSPSDLPIEVLDHFFGAQGQFDNFFKTNLSPFIDNQNSQWHWLTVAGEAMPFSQKALDRIAQSWMIKQMFYPNANQKHAKVRFSLLPMALGPQTQWTKLTINDEAMAISNNNFKLHIFQWPAVKAHEGASIAFQSQKGHTVNERKTGLWGFFRLLDEAQVSELETPDRLQVTFDLNGQSVRMLLLADQTLNPFMLDMLHRFNLPSHLMRQSATD